jgi:hypothetical protein
MRSSSLALFFTLTICTQVFGAAEENAAVKYLRANIALRQAYALEPDAAPALEKALQSPLDQSDEKLIAAASEALTEFQHASTLGTCDWELSVSDGPYANTSHRGAIRELVAVAGIRARLRFRDGHTKEGLQDWLAADTAARQLSTDGTITSVLISYKLEREMSDVLEPELGKLSRSEMDFLFDGARRLQPGMKMQSAIAKEKLDRNDLANVVSGANSREDAIKSLTAGVPILGAKENKAEEIVDGCGGSVESLRTCIRKQSEFYADWSARWSESPAQFEADYNNAFLIASRDNPIVARFTPSLSRLRWAEAYSQTRWILLKAAIAVERDGATALSAFPDPSTGAEFTYSRQEGGFRLESQVKDNGALLSITVQNAGAK